MSLLSVLNVGTRAIFASQLAMDVAGQNISNADVEGYSRKRLNLQPDYRFDSAYGQIGMGVDVINIERLRNEFMDEQIRRQNQQVGYYEELDYTLESIENIFTEPSDTGVIHFVDQFFDSWQNLSNNPSDISARTMVRTNAEILIVFSITYLENWQIYDKPETRKYSSRSTKSMKYAKNCIILIWKSELLN